MLRVSTARLARINSISETLFSKVFPVMDEEGEVTRVTPSLMERMKERLQPSEYMKIVDDLKIASHLVVIFYLIQQIQKRDYSYWRENRNVINIFHETLGGVLLNIEYLGDVSKLNDLLEMGLPTVMKEYNADFSVNLDEDSILSYFKDVPLKKI